KYNCRTASDKNVCLHQPKGHARSAGRVQMRPPHVNQIAMPDTSTISTAQFKQVLEVSRLLAVTTELDTLLSEIATHCTSMLNCERASIFLHDAEHDQLWTKIALGSKEIRVPAGAGIVGFVFKSHQLFH